MLLLGVGLSTQLIFEIILNRRYFNRVMLWKNTLMVLKMPL